ncbi:UDP-glucose 4-epimerase [Streptomyces sp. Ru62]|uniref:NAD-dependent epimerase/dehydratase family protein n=1 Tax=Streptomyces sp. Ru62 TaxID=2080745 RepID=UPI000CDD11C3|nr:NAD-dependent epimerase/dehydratase family protein [Streptomyces sp. Ru62]POX63588.1 UDP-glucose 4-epimerase [Streptomyces sp. Ru62]
MTRPRTLVTGGAGFIGSHVVDHLVATGNAPVVVVDDFSNTTRRWIELHERSGAAVVHALDVLETDRLARTMADGVDRVIHLAASVDMRVGLEDNWVDVEQSVLGTRSVLEAMRRADVRHIVFSSSSTVYGEPEHRPTAEHHGPMLPISVYGAAKLGAEALISAYCHLYGFRAAIFRFGNVVGGRMNHGVIHDFLHKLREDPTCLHVLGDGRQRKNYFLAEDCARGIVDLSDAAKTGVLVVNLGSAETVTVTRIAEIVLEELGLDAEIVYGGGERGWPGDVPVVEFDLSRAHALGWHSSRDSDQAIREAVRRQLRETAHV